MRRLSTSPGSMGPLSFAQATPALDSARVLQSTVLSVAGYDVAEEDVADV